MIHFPLKTLLQCIAKMVIFIMSLGRSHITGSQFLPGHFFLYGFDVRYSKESVKSVKRLKSGFAHFEKNGNRDNLGPL